MESWTTKIKGIAFGLMATLSIGSTAQAYEVIQCNGFFNKAKISLKKMENGELIAHGSLSNAFKEVATFKGQVDSLRKLPIYGTDDTFVFELNRAPIQGKFRNRHGNLYRPVTENDVVVRFKTDVAPHYKIDLVLYILDKNDTSYGATAIYGPCEVDSEKLLEIIGE